ncbi:MAG: dihydroorotate dehydrogenase [Phycisphaerales bacterium]|nr:MAG: dihydroorotate dehydrogenase [Phycisphaerales bacterium]
MSRMPDMSVDLTGIALRNPVIIASGTGGYIGEVADVLNPSRIGAIVTKSITCEPRDGNPPWRVIDVPLGMINAVGLANVGLEKFLAEKLPEAETVDTVVIGSIAGNSVADYVAVAEAFNAAATLPAVELNVSCPNTDDGLQFGEHPRKLRELLSEIRPVLTRTKMIVKLSPNVGDIVAMAGAAIDCGADALTLMNTLHAMAIDVETRQPRLSRGSGGLSGPAIHYLAVRMVHEVYEGVARDAGVPIIGLGGVMRWPDAAELILAGASAVGMGTALFVNPRLPLKVASGLSRWVDKQGCASVSELVGQVQA